MPRRGIDYSTPQHLKIADAKTGAFVESGGVPVIGASIRRWRLLRGMEQKELAAGIGVTSNAVSNWEAGRSRPDINLIPSICRVLQISPYALLGMAEPEAACSPEEERLLGKLRKLGDRFRAHVETVVDSLLQLQTAEETPALVEIEFQPIRLAAGSDAGLRDITESETLLLRDAPLVRRADSVYKVNGDSMEPTYRDGDLVLVEHIPDAAALRFGEIGAFAVGSECYIKEYRPDGLHSHNRRYGVMRFDADSAGVYLLGRVLGRVGPELLPSANEAEHWKSGE